MKSKPYSSWLQPEPLNLSQVISDILFSFCFHYIYDNTIIYFCVTKYVSTNVEHQILLAKANGQVFSLSLDF